MEAIVEATQQSQVAVQQLEKVSFGLKCQHKVTAGALTQAASLCAHVLRRLHTAILHEHEHAQSTTMAPCQLL